MSPSPITLDLSLHIGNQLLVWLGLFAAAVVWPLFRQEVLLDEKQANAEAEQMEQKSPELQRVMRWARSLDVDQLGALIVALAATWAVVCWYVAGWLCDLLGIAR